jgi:hypothetical protein
MHREYIVPGRVSKLSTRVLNPSGTVKSQSPNKIPEKTALIGRVGVREFHFEKIADLPEQVRAIFATLDEKGIFEEGILVGSWAMCSA